MLKFAKFASLIAVLCIIAALVGGLPWGGPGN
jgi:hypothetical protein